MTVAITCPLKWHNRAIRILMLGCGGNGSLLLRDLYRIHCKMCETGHEYGLEITVADGNTVSESNTLRQGFWSSDVGYNKAELCVNRFNLFGHKTQWNALSHHLSAEDTVKMMCDYDILITCVDSAQLRYQIHQEVSRAKHKPNLNCLWLDLGNEQHTGNVFIGNLRTSIDRANCIPNVVDLNPEIKTIVDNPKRSCSARESFQAQDVLVNQFCATLAAKMLNELFTHGRLNYHAVYFDLSTGIDVTQMPVDPKLWSSYFGYNVA